MCTTKEDIDRTCGTTIVGVKLKECRSTGYRNGDINGSTIFQRVA